MNNLKEPLVSVYIPSRNYGKYLDKSIESVINQIYKNWELFIIDEDSKDDTLKIAKKYKNKYSKKLQSLKMIKY